MAKQKRNKLTLYIFIALLLGIIVGYVYNIEFLKEHNTVVLNSDSQIASLDAQLKDLDSSSKEYKDVKAEIVNVTKIKQENQKIRNSKLEIFDILGEIFLRLIKMIVAPLVFTTLVVGVAKLGDIKTVGRVGGKTMLWFISASFISLFMGLLLVNLYQPGLSMNLPLPPVDESVKSYGVGATLSFTQFFTHIFPKSIFDAMAHNEIIQIVVFSIFFGIALAAVKEKGKKLIEAIDALSKVVLKITTYVMYFAPLAVFGAMASIVAKQGLSILSTYLLFILEFGSGLLLLWIIFGIIAYFIIGGRILTLFKHMRDPIMLAFSTSTSEAAYPRILVELEKFGANNKISSFVLPLGYSFNLDGSMIYMTFAAMFISQAYGIHLDFYHQVTMLLLLMVTSKGIAGVPRASLVVIAATLTTFNIPEVGIALLLGIDPLLDMGRSATNVVGNSIAAAVVSKWEGELQDPKVIDEKSAEVV